MAIYVDELNHYGWIIQGKSRLSCHLIADDFQELIDFAVNELGLKIEWFQPKSYPHFDITKFYRDKAIEKGAIEIKGIELVKIIRENRGKG